MLKGLVHSSKANLSAFQSKLENEALRFDVEKKSRSKAIKVLESDCQEVERTLLQVQAALSSEWSMGFNEGFEAATKALKGKFPQIDLAGLRPDDLCRGPEVEQGTPYLEATDDSASDGSPIEPNTLSSVPPAANPRPSQVAEPDQAETTGQSASDLGNA